MALSSAPDFSKALIISSVVGVEGGVCAFAPAIVKQIIKRAFISVLHIEISNTKVISKQ